MSDTITAQATVAEVIEQITAIAPLLRKNGAEGEELRRVPDESIAALKAAGAFRLGTPQRYGGLEATAQEMLDVAAAAAYGDGGAGWVVTLGNVCGWLAGLMSRRLQDEIWGDDPDAFVTGVLAPTASAVRVDGGYRVTGKWFYNSGSYLATWAGVGIPIPNEAGEIVNQGLAVIPRADYDIEETWFVAGMRSSASNCIVVNDVFVPDHRVMMVPPAIGGQYDNEDLADEPTHRTAFVPMLALVLIGAQLGLGRAAFDYVVEKAATKSIAYSFFATQADSTAVQLELAKVALLLDTAELHARRAASDIDSAALAGTYPTYLTRARVRADTALVAESVTHAIDQLISVHGAGAFAESNPLQRIWRDSNTAARHGVVNPLVSYEVYGKALVGNENPVVSPLV
ncbi:acyl-CoA dehydrogenase family protein [Subtercola lobariae]|uniref:Acyl-CoA dehydrogenase n=1 Tax=Subtercola lobariae TaxID=1588641 RepID=A0A917B556_9MICO|nr:acyl-CoA dehydrogenase family protein [Subtercola lobariae]GGF22593.1 acyl-CoA dehydrogenase [Subtercola lobariae]